MRHKLISSMLGAAIAVAVLSGSARAQDEQIPNGWDDHGSIMPCSGCGDSGCGGGCGGDGGMDCGPPCGGCGDCNLCCDPCVPCKKLSFVTGFDFVIMRPHFESNVGMIVNTSDDDTFSVDDTREFDYGYELTPRVWMGWEWTSGLGLRTRFWQYDQVADRLSAQPSPDGFGTVSSPLLAADNRTSVPSTSIPTDRFLASTGMEANVVDVEGTKQIHFDNWSLLATGGVRYAGISQDYEAEVRNLQNQAVERSHFGHRFDGVGPTFSFEARRPVTRFLSAFSAMRGSVLFGDGKMASSTQEDLLLANQFVTLRSSTRDDLLPIGEVQIGAEWTRRLYYGGLLYFRGAFEGQYWAGVGNATSEDGNLGFLGFSATLGLHF